MIGWKDCIIAKRAEEYEWVAYDSNPPRLPLASASSAAELAKKMGVSRSTVEASASRGKNGIYKNSRYMCVYIGDV